MIDQPDHSLRHTIKISDEAHIGGSIWMEPHTRLGAVEAFPNCRMGMHSYMVSGLLRSSVSIGRYCSIGRNVAIGTGEHALEALSTGGPIQRQYGPKKYSIANEEMNIRTVICDDVWIGDKATIFSGVTVGMGAVIGTGAVVTSDIPPYGVAVGVPARIVKYRFGDHVIEQLLKSDWVNFDVDDIISICDGSVEFFLERLRKSDFKPIFASPQHIEIAGKIRQSQLIDRISRLERQISLITKEISEMNRKD